MKQEKIMIIKKSKLFNKLQESKNKEDSCKQDNEYLANYQNLCKKIHLVASKLILDLKVIKQKF